MDALIGFVVTVALLAILGVSGFVYWKNHPDFFDFRSAEKESFDGDHKIVRTWYEVSERFIRHDFTEYHWKCSCGKTGDNLIESEARKASQRHIRAMSALKKNKDDFAW